MLLVATLGAASCAAPAATPPAKPVAEPPRPAPSLVAQEKSRAAVASVPAGDAQNREPAAPPADRVAGWVAGEPLAFEEILSEWHAISPRDVFYVVEKLVSGRLAVAEAGRLGIRLAPELVEAEVAAQTARFRADAAKTAPGQSIDDFIRKALDVEPARHWANIRDGVIRQMLAERAVRSFGYENENASVRLIVVATEDEAEALADELTAGADFAELAAAKSLDESGKGGGLVPFVVRQESSPLARVAFAAQPGEVVGPVAAAGHFFLVRVEERRKPIAGGWSELRPAVEDSLRAYPVLEAEFLHWKLEMERRYSIDLAPLFEALGTPGRPESERRDP
jgi:hypothetical protein